MAHHRVAILGAGVIGLSTAVCVQELHPDCHVTIISDSFSPHTTSDGSGGFWYPYALSDTDPRMIRETGMATFKFLKSLALSSEAGVSGVQLVSGTTYEQADKTDDPVKDMVDDYRKLSPEELKPYPGYRMGFFYTSPIVDVSVYLKWLMLRFKKNGGAVICRKIHSMQELSGVWDVVVNCCGLGAKELLQDDRMYPIRGQVIKVDAPWIKHYTVFVPENGHETYVLPGARWVVVGGIADRGDWNTKVKADTETDIWQRALSLVPQLTHARKIKSWAGLRPCRSEIRLEREIIGRGEQALRVVHNYGHGGSGVTLHWGCAQKAAALVSDFLHDISRPLNSVVSSVKHKL